MRKAPFVYFQQMYRLNMLKFNEFLEISKTAKNFKKHLQIRYRYGRIFEHEKCRYALMREVAGQSTGEFPRSMSDFKPGDKLLRCFSACVCET